MKNSGSFFDCYELKDVDEGEFFDRNCDCRCCRNILIYGIYLCVCEVEFWI